MEGELTSVKVSRDSRYALINRALDSFGLHAVSRPCQPSHRLANNSDASYVTMFTGDPSVGD